MKRLVFLMALLTAGPVFAARDDRHICRDTKRLLNGVAGNASAANRTFQIDNLDGYDILHITPQYTKGTTADVLTFTCTGKSDRAADAEVTQVDTSLTTCTTASGTCTLNFAGSIVTPSLSTDKDFSFLLGISGEETIKCVVVFSTAEANDAITITGRACVQGR